MSLSKQGWNLCSSSRTSVKSSDENRTQATHEWMQAFTPRPIARAVGVGLEQVPPDASLAAPGGELP